jgi:hypothetical protein
MSRIPVAILLDGGDPDLVTSYFDEKYFNVFTVSGKPTVLPLDYERHVIRAALIESAERSPIDYCILIRDTSITSFSQEEIVKIVQETMRGDIVYLTRWEDRCDQLVDVEEIYISEKTSVKFTQTISPKGLQAIMLGPKLRDFIRGADFKYETFLGEILTDLIEKGVIKGHAFIPNIFNFDAVRYATNMDEFKRLNICREINAPTNISQVGAETYFYLTAIIGFFIVAGWGMYLLGPEPRKKKERKGLTEDKPEQKKMEEYYEDF